MGWCTVLCVKIFTIHWARICFVTGIKSMNITDTSDLKETRFSRYLGWLKVDFCGVKYTTIYLENFPPVSMGISRPYVSLYS